MLMFWPQISAIIRPSYFHIDVRLRDYQPEWKQQRITIYFIRHDILGVNLVPEAIRINIKDISPQKEERGVGQVSGLKWMRSGVWYKSWTIMFRVSLLLILSRASSSTIFPQSLWHLLKSVRFNHKPELDGRMWRWLRIKMFINVFHPSRPVSFTMDLEMKTFILIYFLSFTSFLKRFIQWRDTTYFSRILRKYYDHGGLHKFI